MGLKTRRAKRIAKEKRAEILCHLVMGRLSSAIGAE